MPVASRASQGLKGAGPGTFPESYHLRCAHLQLGSVGQVSPLSPPHQTGKGVSVASVPTGFAGTGAFQAWTWEKVRHCLPHTLPLQLFVSQASGFNKKITQLKNKTKRWFGGSHYDGGVIYLIGSYFINSY